jgi:DHA3 family macrolide efflux protein-like MFS transporter
MLPNLAGGFKPGRAVASSPPLACPTLTATRLNFAIFWVGQFVSRFGDSMFHIGLVWLALELTGSKAAMGLISMAGYLPALLFGLYAGAIADRVDRRRLMMGADVLQALAVASIPALHALGALSGWHLAAAAFVLATGASLFGPARDSFVPVVADQSRLLRANSFLHLSGHLAWVLGPAAAGLVIAWVGTVHLFTVDSLTFVVSLATLALLRLPRGAAKAPVDPERPSATAAALEGVRHVWADGRLRMLLLLTAADNLVIMGPAVVGTPIFVQEALGGGPADYAVQMACLFGGMATGALLIGRFGEHLPKGRMLLLGIVLDGLTFLPFALCHDLVSMGALLFVHGLTVPLLVSARPAIIQENVPDALRGRVFSLVDLTVVGSTAVSCGLTGMAADVVSMRTIYVAIGLAGALLGALGFLHRALRETR